MLRVVTVTVDFPPSKDTAAQTRRVRVEVFKGLGEGLGVESSMGPGATILHVCMLRTTVCTSVQSCCSSLATPALSLHSEKP